MKKLIEKIKEDIKQNPEKREEYLAILADLGLLKGKILKVKKISAELMNSLEDKTIIILK